MHSSMGKVAGYVAGFASLFLIWHACSTWLLNSVLFPPPWQVIGPLALPATGRASAIT